jgi:hypothetical protein
MRKLTTGLVVGCVLAAVAGMTEGQSASTASLNKLPLYFVENQGVYPDEVRFYIQGADKTLFFTDHGVTVAFRNEERGWTVKLDFVDANPEARPIGLKRQAAVFSYFKGPQEDWKAGLPSFSSIVYRDLWPGIDLAYNGTVNQLKYEFVVAPGADPSMIRLQYRGATSVSTTDAGALRVETPGGSFEDAPPVAWQEIDGRRAPVAMAYALGEDGAFGFTVGKFDRRHSLILDPAVVIYCGYIGGTGTDWGTSVAVDRNGSLIAAGWTLSPSSSFPVKIGPTTTTSGLADVFVAKVDRTGQSLVYCGFIGGAGEDWGYGVAADAAGNAYVVGGTESNEASFPVVGGPSNTLGGVRDAFVAKIDPTGRNLIYCGYLGGDGWDDAWGVTADAAGNTYVTGRTGSKETTFPVKVGPDLTRNGPQDAFVAKLTPSGQIIYCGYIGGGYLEWGQAIAVDAAGAAYVWGNTSSDETTFPVKVGPDLTFNGSPALDDDAFIAKVNPAGTALEYCGYIGGQWSEAYGERGFGIAVDAAGCAHVTGSTCSSENQGFPVTVGPDLTYNGGAGDAFVAKVSASGQKLLYCGYVGGAQGEEALGIALDRDGRAIVVGRTGSNEQTFPVTGGPSLTYHGSGDGFIAWVDPRGTHLSRCGYFGSSGCEFFRGIALDTAGNAYLIGTTQADEKIFPVKVGPDLTYNGGPPAAVGDTFVAKFAFMDSLTASGIPRPGGTITLDLAAMEARGLPYQLGSSFGAGPTPVDTREIGLLKDDLLFVSVAGLWPTVFQGYTGTLDAAGKARATIVVPMNTALVGTDVHSAAVTFDPSWRSGIRSISVPVSFRILQ